jgi:hypothetical protein
VCKDKIFVSSFNPKYQGFLKQKIMVFQSRFVPLSACIFFAEKAKKDTAAIGARLENLVFNNTNKLGC